MKKILATLLSITLVFVLLTPQACADTVTSSDLYAIACESFPEFASRITQCASSRETASNENLVLRISATRRLSENQQIQYQEFSDGSIYVSLMTDNQYTPSITVVDSRTGTGYSYRKVNIQVLCVDSNQVFLAKNVEFTFVQGGTSAISSTGSLSDSTTTEARVDGSKLSGSDSSPAYVLYYAVFRGSRQSYDPYITFYVSGSGYRVYVSPK